MSNEAKVNRSTPVTGVFYTYMHTRKDTGKPFYFGKGVLGRAWSKGGRCKHWHNIKGAHGIDVHILARWRTNEDAINHEKFLISCFRDLKYPLANITDGGEGAFGMRHTEAMKQKLSRERKGKKITPEHAANISLRLMGRVFTESHRANLSLANTGQKRSAKLIESYLPNLRAAMATPEVRAKMSSAARLRPPVSIETRKKIGAAHVARNHSTATKVRMSEAAKARYAKKKEAAK